MSLNGRRAERAEPECATPRVGRGVLGGVPAFASAPGGTRVPTCALWSRWAAVSPGLCLAEWRLGVASAGGRGRAGGASGFTGGRSDRPITRPSGSCRTPLPASHASSGQGTVAPVEEGRRGTRAVASADGADGARRGAC